MSRPVGSAWVGYDIADAIERFANKLADELDKQAGQALANETAAALERAARAAREAGKTRRTRNRDHRAAQGKGE
jgi:hypothetical protein